MPCPLHWPHAYTGWVRSESWRIHGGFVKMRIVLDFGGLHGHLSLSFWRNKSIHEKHVCQSGPSNRWRRLWSLEWVEISIGVYGASYRGLQPIWKGMLKPKILHNRHVFRRRSSKFGMSVGLPLKMNEIQLKRHWPLILTLKRLDLQFHLWIEGENIHSVPHSFRIALSCHLIPPIVTILPKCDPDLIMTLTSYSIWPLCDLDLYLDLL